MLGQECLDAGVVGQLGTESHEPDLRLEPLGLSEVVHVAFGLVRRGGGLVGVARTERAGKSSDVLERGERRSPTAEAPDLLALVDHGLRVDAAVSIAAGTPR